MTISMQEYFRTRKADRKKEIRYINYINKDSCTSCNSCATVCPVDCIYEVVSPVPSESYHKIDITRCIGCQMCYRVPADSTEHYTLEICPWNAIDMVHNPNIKPDDVSVLEPYYRGDASAEINWPKLEEYGYQLFLDGEIILADTETEIAENLTHFQQQVWMFSEDENCRVLNEAEHGPGYLRYQATDDGRDLLDVIYQHYGRIFMD